MDNNMSEEKMTECVKAVTAALDDQKATGIEVLHIAKLTTMADYFVICTGSSTTHMRTLSEAVQKTMEEKYGIRPHHVEGHGNASWELVDFGFMIVHIFHKDAREFYSLERLWADAPKAAGGEDGESK